MSTTIYRQPPLATQTHSMREPRTNSHSNRGRPTITTAIRRLPPTTLVRQGAMVEARVSPVKPYFLWLDFSVCVPSSRLENHHDIELELHTWNDLSLWKCYSCRFLVR